MPLVYIVRTFPKLSESFVLREVMELCRRGEDVMVWSLLPSGDDEAAVAGFDAVRHVVRTLPRGPRLLAALAGAVVVATARHPVRTVGALAWAARWSLSERDPRHLAAHPFAAFLAPRVPADAHVHAHFANAPATVAALVARLTGRSWSFSGYARDLFAVTSPGFLAEKVRRAEFAAVTSDYSVTRIAPGLRPADRDKLVVVRTGLPREAPAARRPEPGLIVAVARLVPKKGLDVLAEACALLRARGHDVRCEILGGGPLQPELADQAARLQLGDAFVLRGAADRAAVEDALGRAAAFALPCRLTADGDEDNLPVALLEAMQRGVPVVTTAVAGIPEAVEDERTGLIVAEDDADALAAALERLLADAELGARLGSAGQALVAERFDVAANVAALAGRFARVALSPSRARAEGDRSRP